MVGPTTTTAGAVRNSILATGLLIENQGACFYAATGQESKAIAHSKAAGEVLHKLSEQVPSQFSLNRNCRRTTRT